MPTLFPARQSSVSHSAVNPAKRVTRFTNTANAGFPLDRFNLSEDKLHFSGSDSKRRLEEPLDTHSGQANQDSLTLPGLSPMLLPMEALDFMDGLLPDNFLLPDDFYSSQGALAEEAEMGLLDFDTSTPDFSYDLLKAENPALAKELDTVRNFTKKCIIADLYMLSAPHKRESWDAMKQENPERFTQQIQQLFERVNRESGPSSVLDAEEWRSYLVAQRSVVDLNDSFGRLITTEHEAKQRRAQAALESLNQRHPFIANTLNQLHNKTIRCIASYDADSTNACCNFERLSGIDPKFYSPTQQASMHKFRTKLQAFVVHKNNIHPPSESFDSALWGNR
ncbi:hypothetical protein [Vampirovibrio sp.]|uniref:hypothetical protein n=1 Tax=Vampirovibrio sp. TaxID=2717857 RepID=UPI0035935D13